ncbi:TPA: WYL domain-containing protein [Stenotrophomonas maltophilia]|nr:WYL domain-containing protein [Stenotrophomonas maltophilia]MBH1711309.1 WYL domain-containing protein [Stenotrophomonas maltophilia]HEL3759489.1 WYL domain-containing protein [Stenotrophomonas maltophilia]
MSSNTNDTLMRQWEMLRLLPRAPRKTTVAELQRRLEIQDYPASSRTIERDLKNLSLRFGLVVDESSKPYGWSWAKDANFEFTPRLSTSQGVALLLAQEHLRNFLPRTLLKDLWPLFQMAEKELASTGWKDWHKRTAILPTSLPLLAPNVAGNVLEVVHRALALKTCLRGVYHAKGTQAAKEMKIHPLGLLVRGSAQYLVCTLRDYKDIRHLALHRLGAVALLDEPCVPPADFDFVRYVDTSGSRYHAQGKIRLRARFKAEAAEHLRDTPISDDQQISESDESGWVELTAIVESDETLRWWLLGFGSRVEVQEPAALREEIHSELASAADRYRQN